jgi:hypothetical protein
MGGEWVAVLREPWPPLAGGGARVRTAATAEVAVEAVLA